MREVMVAFWLMIAFIVGTLLLGCISAKMESDTYNRLTGAHTTWWDAMWVELRVQDQPK